MNGAKDQLRTLHGVGGLSHDPAAAGVHRTPARNLPFAQKLFGDVVPVTTKPRSGDAMFDEMIAHGYAAGFAGVDETEESTIARVMHPLPHKPLAHANAGSLNQLSTHAP